MSVGSDPLRRPGVAVAGVVRRVDELCGPEHRHAIDRRRALVSAHLYRGSGRPDHRNISGNAGRRKIRLDGSLARRDQLADRRRVLGTGDDRLRHFRRIDGRSVEVDANNTPETTVRRGTEKSESPGRWRVSVQVSRKSLVVGSGDFPRVVRARVARGPRQLRVLRGHETLQLARAKLHVVGD